MLTLSSAVEIEAEKEINERVDALKNELLERAVVNDLADYKYRIGFINGLRASLEVVKEASARLQRN
jgi:hypothetical protein